MVTTAHPTPGSTNTAPTQPTHPRGADTAETQANPTTTTGVVRQWVSELAGAARPGAGGQGTVRVPTSEEIQTLTSMFPDVPRDVILGVLQRR